jgi:chlorobactene glucosyltransferase
VQTKPLPSGWCGKNFACAQLADAARGRWLLFLDADARLTEGAVARMLTEAVHRNTTFLSCWPRLQMVGFWEKVLMPLLNFLVFTIYPAPLSLVRHDASLGLAHGACLLIEKATYETLGGHATVRGEIFEDTRLAKLWREHGERSLCLDGSSEVSVRMYGSLTEIWLGFQKNFFPAFRREASFWGFLLLHAVMFWLPLFLLVWVQRWQIIAAAVCVVLMRLSLALRFRHPLWSVALHPLGETMLIALAVSSWWRCKSGRGVVWKERTYRSA